MKSPICVLWLMVIALSTTTHAELIDDFTVAPFALTYEQLTPNGIVLTQSNLDGSHVMGGEREVNLGWGGGPIQSLEVGNGALVGSVAPGQLHYSSITYGSVENPLGDLIANGNNAFQLDFINVSGVSGSISMISESDFVSTGFSLSESEVITIPFKAFSGVNFADATSVSLSFNRSGSFSLGSFQTVPEPAISAILLATCCILLRGRSGHVI